MYGIATCVHNCYYDYDKCSFNSALTLRFQIAPTNYKIQKNLLCFTKILLPLLFSYITLFKKTAMGGIHEMHKNVE